jgi:hypothetical protein
MTFQVIVYFEELIGRRESVEGAKKGEVLAGILSEVIKYKNGGQVGLTFWEYRATRRTREKSYIPRAVSNRRSASTRKIMYFTASSTIFGFVSGMTLC